MLLDGHTAAYQEAFMIDFNNLTYEPTDFLSHPSPFLNTLSLPYLSFLRTLKEYLPHCALFSLSVICAVIPIFQKFPSLPVKKVVPPC